MYDFLLFFHCCLNIYTWGSAGIVSFFKLLKTFQNSDPIIKEVTPPTKKPVQPSVSCIPLNVEINIYIYIYTYEYRTKSGMTV